MYGADRCTCLCTHGTNQRCFKAFQHRDVSSALLRRCCRFQTNESSTNHHHANAFSDLIAQCCGISQRAQGVNAGDVRLIRQTTHISARCNDEPVIGQGLTIRQCQGLGCGVEARCCNTQFPCEVQFFQSLRLPQSNTLFIPVTGEIVLRQRWAVVRHVCLGTHHRDGAREATRAQCFRRTGSGQRGSDNHNVLHADRLGLPRCFSAFLLSLK